MRWVAFTSTEDGEEFDVVEVEAENFTAARKLLLEQGHNEDDFDCLIASATLDSFEANRESKSCPLETDENICSITDNSPGMPGSSF